jgi:hypothetical protein
MAATDPIAIERRRFSIRLPRPLWIGLATVVLVVFAAGLKIGTTIYRQHVAFREIERVGGSVSTDPRGPEWLRDRVGDEWMKLTGDVVIGAHLEHTHLTDATLRDIRWLTELQGLCLYCTRVNDADLLHLDGLTNLRVLFLDQTRVTDAGLAHLKRLRSLETLCLYGTSVTDEGVAELKRALPGLTVCR